jgi:paraquat-inducible protein B
MKTKVNPAIVGAFVLGAMVIGFMALLMFGGVNFFAHPERFVVYFHESIHGLDLGSPVQLRGVRVGRVVDLNVRYDAATNDPAIAVTCELNKNKIRDGAGAVLDITAPGELQKLVDRGLRAQLVAASLATGLLYVELDFIDPRTNPAGKPPPNSQYVVVPSTLSAIEEFQNSAIEILTNVRRIDFAGLSTQLKELLADARRQVDSLDLKGAVDQWRDTGASVQALAQSADLKRSLANFAATLDEVRVTLRKVDTQVDANGQNLQASLASLQGTLKDFSSTAVTVRRFVAAQQNLGADANQALANLADAASAVGRLADFLERNPNALLSGKRPPAPLPVSTEP